MKSRDAIGNFRPPGHAPSPDVVCRASGNRSADVSFSKDGRSLTCQGLVIDPIDDLGPVHHPAPDGKAEATLHIVQATSETNTRPRRNAAALDRSLSRAASDAVLETLVRSVSLDRAGRYLTPEARTAWYINELQRVLAAADGARSPEQIAVVKWVEANQGLRVQGATLR
ncbi:hypothetical protein N0V82_006996 [Gnomoniopsis sp. IMI 355080]|nr:hypothetical protein N0V82_006996 [Gnomoniopsis sp. IMI 355080]